MGRGLIIIVGAAAILGSLSLTGGAGTSAVRTLEDVASHGERVLARQIALSGHDATLAAVKADAATTGSYFGPDRYEGAYQGGTYASTVDPSEEYLTIVTRAQRKSTSYVIRARYRWVDMARMPPPFMAAAIFSGNNLKVQSPLTVNSLAPDVNVTMHTNGHLKFKPGSNPSLIQGVASHRGHFVAANGQLPEQIFQPPLYTPGMELTQKVDAVPMPDFDPSSYIGIATTTIDGNARLAGTIELGTKEEPAIWYVGGNLFTDGPVEFEGYGILIVSGNVQIRHDVSLASGVESRMAMYNDGQMEFRDGADNIQVTGHLYSTRNMRFYAPTTINGGLTAGIQLVVDAPVTVNFDAPACEIIDPVFPDACQQKPVGSDLFVLVDYREGG